MTSKHNQLSNFNTKLGGSISRLDNDRILHFQNENGNGRASSLDVGSEILYSEYDFELAESFNFQLECVTQKRLYFIYCMEGDISYSLTGANGQREQVEEFQTVILGCSNNDLRIFISKEKRVRFSIIRVEYIEEENEYSKDVLSLNKSLFEQFSSNDAGTPFSFHCTFNLNIKDQLMQIQKVSQNGVVRRLLIKSFVYYTLALEILQHQSDKKNEQSGSNWMSKNELMRIKNAIDAITEKPGEAYSIPKLSREYGISNVKLQEGFKLLVGMTATTYIKKVRLELAEKLIKEGNMNISEVVYSIGFTSRSYFSKIFKKRYNCSPKYYLENCRNMADA